MKARGIEMKKTAILLLIILLAMSISCCHQKENASESGAKATPPEAAVSDTESGMLNGRDANLSGAAMLADFTVLSQLPELPTGCEVTSLTMALNYCGVEADKCDIADNYLDKGVVGTVDFRVAFEGDPRDEYSYGCYAPVLLNAANRYLEAQDSDLRAKDLTGTAFEQLLSYIDSGIPVIVWGTVDCEEPVNRISWEIDGEELKWYSPEHCMVLIGYDDRQVTVADPLKGATATFDRELFKARYNDLFQQAIVIEKGDSPADTAE